jgi:hypothetical protein
MRSFAVYRVSNLWFTQLITYLDSLLKEPKPIELRKVEEDGMKLVSTIDNVEIIKKEKVILYKISVSIDDKTFIRSRDGTQAAKITNSAEMIIYKSEKEVHQFLIVFSSGQKSDRIIDVINFILKEKKIAGDVNNPVIENVEFELDCDKVIKILSPLEFKGAHIDEIQGDIHKAKISGDKIEDTDELHKFTDVQHGKLLSIRVKIPFENRLVKLFLQLEGCGIISNGMDENYEKEAIENLFYQIVKLIK